MAAATTITTFIKEERQRQNLQSQPVLTRRHICRYLAVFHQKTMVVVVVAVYYYEAHVVPQQPRDDYYHYDFTIFVLSLCTYLPPSAFDNSPCLNNFPNV